MDINFNVNYSIYEWSSFVYRSRIPLSCFSSIHGESTICRLGGTSYLSVKESMEDITAYNPKVNYSHLDKHNSTVSKLQILQQVVDLLNENDRSQIESKTHDVQTLLNQNAARFLEVRDSSSDIEGLLLGPELLTENSEKRLIEIMKQEISRAKKVYFSSAFCSSGVINLLIDPLMDLKKRGGSFYLLTSFMNHFNNPSDLIHMQNYLGMGNIRIYDPDTDGVEMRNMKSPPKFHVKAYLFEKENEEKSLIIGSSNLTLSGVVKNVEWNYFAQSEVSIPFSKHSIFDQAKKQFDAYWSEQSFPLSSKFAEDYIPVWKSYRSSRQEITKTEKFNDSSKREEAEPREAQQLAMNNLADFRRQGIQKAAVIAATGLGKTYLAAFDAKQAGAMNILYIAHRENILLQAQETFQHVYGDTFHSLLATGNNLVNPSVFNGREKVSLFGSIIYFSNQLLDKIPALYFDYVIIDEFHHAAANSYKILFDKIDAKFLLGITATPERMDGRDVLELCDYTIAYESRMLDSIGKGWLSPFQYYAIYDPTDYSSIRWTGSRYDEKELEDCLSQDTRVELIAGNLRKYLPAHGKIKTLGFCANIGHAQYMTREFNKRNITSAIVTGNTSIEDRSALIASLSDENHSLQVIFSINVFNEGIDIPEITHILLLRPTESYTLLVQQLGRGLRKSEGKEYVVILDFIGNYRNNYIKWVSH